MISCLSHLGDPQNPLKHLYVTLLELTAEVGLSFVWHCCTCTHTPPFQTNVMVLLLDLPNSERILVSLFTCLLDAFRYVSTLRHTTTTTMSTQCGHRRAAASVSLQGAANGCLYSCCVLHPPPAQQVVMQIMHQLDESDAALANALCETLLQRMLPSAQTANPICYKYALKHALAHFNHPPPRSGLWPTC